MRKVNSKINKHKIMSSKVENDKCGPTELREESPVASNHRKKCLHNMKEANTSKQSQNSKIGI